MCIYNILVPFKPFFYIKVINLYVRNVRFYIAVNIYNKKTWLNTPIYINLGVYFHDNIVIEIINYLIGVKFKNGNFYNNKPTAFYLDPYQQIKTQPDQCYIPLKK